MCFAYPTLGAAKPGQLEKDPLRDASEGAPVVLMVPLSDEFLDVGHMPARSRQGKALIEGAYFMLKMGVLRQALSPLPSPTQGIGDPGGEEIEKLDNVMLLSRPGPA